MANTYTSPHIQKEQRAKRVPRVAIVLGAGGLKTAGSIELFQLLEEKNIPIDLVVGSSGGAIFGVMKGMGYSSKQMRQAFFSVASPSVFQSVDYFGALRLFWNIHYKTFPALLQGNLYLTALRKLYQDTQLEDLSVKTIVQATDFDTGEEIMIEEGRASDAIYASSTVVPILPMIEINGRKLIDGGYTNSLPITTALNRGADIIIAMGFWESVEQTDNIVDETMNFIDKASREVRSWKKLVELDNQHYHEIVVIDVVFEKAIPWSDFNNMGLVYEKSKEAVKKAEEQIMIAIDSWYAC